MAHVLEPAVLALLEEVNISLEERELGALRHFVRSKDHPIALDTSLKMFELFLNGRTCDQIRQLNHGFQLGAIVHARVVHRWDAKRKELIELLHATVVEKTRMALLGAAHVSADMLSAASRYWTEKLAKYFQSGDPADLPAELKEVKNYPKLVNNLLVATGQNGGKVRHEHSVVSPAKSAPGAPGAKQDLDHSDILALLAGDATGEAN